MVLDIVFTTCAAVVFSSAADVQEPIAFSRPVYTQQQTDPTPPIKATVAEFKKLKFLEGKWRGTGYKTPFFESYRFVNDSTIESFTSDDASFANRKPGSKIVLRNGSIYSEDDGRARYAVTRMDKDGYRFTAINRPGFFVWKGVHAKEWTALLGNGTVYRMHRID
jgi:hypothetical protein